MRTDRHDEANSRFFAILRKATINVIILSSFFDENHYVCLNMFLSPAFLLLISLEQDAFRPLSIVILYALISLCSRMIYF